MKTTRILLFLLLFQSGFAQNSFAQEWQLVWSDEFDGSGLDQSKWSYQIGTGAPLLGWGNNELQYYTNRPVNVDVFGGQLIITAMRENFGGMPYTSARIRTKNKGDWKYGKIEIRAKLPTGKGLWPAFWMLPTDEVFGGWPQSGEIDIMELIGSEPNKVHGTIHYGNPWPQNQYQGNSYTLPQGNFIDNFHTFRVEWAENEIYWFVDSVQYSFKGPRNLGQFNWPFNERFHIILNLAVGGNWPGSPDSSAVFPQSFIVDYVRVYQKTALSANRDMSKPQAFALKQNYPNPFNPSATLAYELPKASDVTLEVFDVLGRRVAALVNERQNAGFYAVPFNASLYNLSSGIYFYKLRAGDYAETRKMILTK
jgi:beta-glucanase (GH16 family)